MQSERMWQRGKEKDRKKMKDKGKRYMCRKREEKDIDSEREERKICMEREKERR
jgi:hypothetical protein